MIREYIFHSEHTKIWCKHCPAWCYKELWEVAKLWPKFRWNCTRLVLLAHIGQYIESRFFHEDASTRSFLEGPAPSRVRRGVLRPVGRERRRRQWRPSSSVQLRASVIMVWWNPSILKRGFSNTSFYEKQDWTCCSLLRCRERLSNANAKQC